MKKKTEPKNKALVRAAAVTKIISGLTAKERDAIERLARTLKDFRFPKDRYRATRRKITRLELKLLKDRKSRRRKND